MDKIYSRKRIKIPIIRSNNKTVNSKDISVIKILVVIGVALITTNWLSNVIDPVFDYMCRDKVKSIATVVSNEKATVVMKQHSYDDMFYVEKDLNENVSMIKSNVIAINEITSSVTIEIQEGLNNINRDSLKIPLRYFYRNKVDNRKRTKCGNRSNALSNY